MSFKVNNVQQVLNARGEGCDVPLTEISQTMSSLATGNSSPFRVRGDGVLSILVTLPDANSADGEFYIQVAESAGGTFSTLSTPVLSKVAGVALSAEQILVDKPGAQWARVRYVRSSGGAAGEITLTGSAW